MTTKDLYALPPPARDRLFASIKGLVEESEAIDRSLEGVAEGYAVDETLELIVEELARERRASRRTRRPAAL